LLVRSVHVGINQLLTRLLLGIVDDNSLMGSIPSVIGDLEKLELLRLGERYVFKAFERLMIDERLPYSFKNKTYFADHNGLVETIPTQLGSIESLEYLLLGKLCFEINEE